GCVSVPGDRPMAHAGKAVLFEKGPLRLTFAAACPLQRALTAERETIAFERSAQECGIGSGRKALMDTLPEALPRLINIPIKIAHNNGQGRVRRFALKCPAQFHIQPCRPSQEREQDNDKSANKKFVFPPHAEN